MRLWRRFRPFPEPIPEPPVIRHPNFADAMLFLLMLLVGRC
jgi:hypothetical protein